ncbi:hypothetical protein [Actinomycetospora lemnae]|uniref:Uncharacterized protein n=1 Tax=Actinomycetospora lemnae TaxID=3019891 RepID=A0ABT5SVZ0_9PSEU|nr:hypothetical protein [Actinomycetospora sp. DW7H6]MDD7966635.1 hypothetical protein [Actinomycetospora sp. DW7H6]
MDERSPRDPYTIHDDVDAIDTTTTTDTTTDTHDEDTAPARRPGPDPLALVAGLTAIVVAVLAVTSTLATVDPRWVLVLAAVGVGVSVLWVTVRRRS